jgi:15-cis-phytoene desaturase
MPDAPSVLVLGGGVAGMTAAHELAERGFKVTVIERRAIPGGKARSLPVIGSNTEGRTMLPAEHGFRFFPGFYQHIPDTMCRIPFGTNPNGVYDNLRESTRARTARAGRKALEMPTRLPGDRDERRLWRKAIFRNGLNIPVCDLVHFAGLLLKLSASCEARRYEQYENESWWEFSGAEKRSRSYQQFLADGLTRSLVAAKARQMSARTGGYILLQLLQSFGPHPKNRGVDRVLNGPTNEAWIDPWLDHITSLGVTYVHGQVVKSIEIEGDRVSKVVVNVPNRFGGTDNEVTADWIIAALPVEVMAPLVNDDMLALDPSLGELANLTTRWMNGVMFYLRRPVPVTHGHVIYIDSPWSLTSISQGQFWEGGLDGYGDGTVREILSVDVSDWETPGVIYNRSANECTHDEIVAEVWMQLKEHLNVGEDLVLLDDDLIGAFIDQDIVTDGPHHDINLEPLLINTAGSWATRPTGVTGISNLLLASDYVRTYTDLATMEGANEAARRAVNVLLDRTRSRHERCKVFALHEPVVFRPFQIIDRLIYTFTSQRSHRHAPLGPGHGQ